MKNFILIFFLIVTGCHKTENMGTKLLPNIYSNLTPKECQKRVEKMGYDYAISPLGESAKLLTIKNYEYFLDTGLLQILFREDKLAEVVFNPSNPKIILSSLKAKKQIDFSKTKGSICKEGVCMNTGINDFGLYISWYPKPVGSDMHQDEMLEE
ncbi:MAG: hypothetical protein ACPGJS_12650 [Flammeovirgaceae bacterium]